MQRRREQHRPEDEQRDAAEHIAHLFRQAGHLAALVTTNRPEDHSGDEGCDEARAAERRGDPIGERGTCRRDDLQPGGGDQATAGSEDDGPCGDDAAGKTAGDSPADLLDHEPNRVSVADLARLGLRESERNEQERHTDTVVEPALDIEALTDAGRQAAFGQNGLPEGGVCRREHHAQNDRFRDRQRSKEQACEERSGDDRQR